MLKAAEDCMELPAAIAASSNQTFNMLCIVILSKTDIFEIRPFN